MLTKYIQIIICISTIITACMLSSDFSLLLMRRQRSSRCSSSSSSTPTTSSHDHLLHIANRGGNRQSTARSHRHHHHHHHPAVDGLWPAMKINLHSAVVHRTRHGRRGICVWHMAHNSNFTLDNSANFEGRRLGANTPRNLPGTLRSFLSECRN